MVDQTPEGIDPAEVARGRRFLLISCGFLALTSLVVMATYNLRRGPDRLPQQLVRFGLLLLLCSFVMRGRTWARWTLFACLLGGIWLAVPGLFRKGAFNSGNLPGTLMFLVMYVGYSVVARGLLYSRNVRAFFLQSHQSDPGDCVTEPPKNR